ncbi:MAG TPA: FAD-dependent oxidoreductase [Thermoleophilaceae bacterium]|nr:FAD-dependent oxidoreductase [Thermoleophilaceae bacterium]
MAESPTEPIRADIAVIGAGAAGLYAALAAAREGARVVLVSRSALAESASYWAQGGIAAAIAAEDSPDRHLADTLAAGRGTTRASAARVLCREAPARVRDLESLGVRFDADRHGALALGLEGGHSARRVVHAGGSATGRRITRQLSAIAATDKRIEVLERATAGVVWTLDGRCIGVRADRAGGDSVAVLARATLIATGGAAALWERTTNPRGAIGAGMTLAHAAGAALADMEMVQFHPTALSSGGERDGFLITEAVRGEGALLYDGSGERFVDELAPRDEVALAVRRKLDAGERVELDMTMVQPGRFPNVVNTLNEVGIDPYRERVPVAPAAHYTMGGIATDVDGASSLGGLYAVGECACNGLHGANRLASNSLAECFVFGRRAALAGLAEPEPPPDPGAPPAGGPNPVPPRETRTALWRLAGIERSAERLRELVDDAFPLARIVAASALARQESRGAHQRSDFPETDTRFDRMHAVARDGDDPRFERWD